MSKHEQIPDPEIRCNSFGIAVLMRESDAIHRRNMTRRENGLPEDRKAKWQAYELHHEILALRRCAAQQFAELNGWRYSRRTFGVTTMARGGCHDGRNADDWSCGPNQLFDHPVYFREFARPYRTAAIVGQPYGTSLESATELAAGLGLVVHAPPNLTASWWYPGVTRLFCVTRPEVSLVRFLPDQYIIGDLL